MDEYNMDSEEMAWWINHCRYLDADEWEAAREWPENWPGPGDEPGVLN